MSSVCLVAIGDMSDLPRQSLADTQVRLSLCFWAPSATFFSPGFCSCQELTASCLQFSLGGTILDCLQCVNIILRQVIFGLVILR